jgi:hypothetical protein
VRRVVLPDTDDLRGQDRREQANVVEGDLLAGRHRILEERALQHADRVRLELGGAGRDPVAETEADEPHAPQATARLFAPDERLSAGPCGTPPARRPRVRSRVAPSPAARSPHRPGDRTPDLAGGLGLRRGVNGPHEQPSVRAVHRGVDERDEPVAVEHRHRVVPVPTLGLGDVDLHPIREIEQQLRTRSVGDQVVERRQHRGARHPPAAFDPVEQRNVVPVHVPGAGHGGTIVLDRHTFDPAGPLELVEHARQFRVPVPGEVVLDLPGCPDPQTVERTVDGPPRDLEVRQPFGGASGDRTRSVRSQSFWIPSRPATMIAPDPHRNPSIRSTLRSFGPAARPPRLPRQAAGDPPREHRAVAADLPEHGALEPRVGRHPVQAAAVPPGPVVAEVPAHVPGVDRVILGEHDRGRVRPVLVDRAVAPQQSVQVLRVEPRDPCAEHQVRAPRHDRDRVELHAPDRADDARARPAGSNAAARPRGPAPRSRVAARSRGRSFGGSGRPAQASLVPRPQVTPTLRQ